MARVTVKTLAAAVGVSPSTISNAYNRPDQLSAQLRRRILAKADEMGYAGPDAAGRTLRVGRADAVGVLLAERLSYAFSDPYAIEFLAGLSEIAEERGISIVLMPLSSDGELIEAWGDDLRSVRQASVDALAMLSLPGDHPAAQLARARGIRLVTTDPSEDPKSSWVAIDDQVRGSPDRVAPGASWGIETSSWWSRPIGRPAARRRGCAIDEVSRVRICRSAAWPAGDHSRNDDPDLRRPQLLRLGSQRRHPPGGVRIAAERDRRAQRRDRPRRALRVLRERGVSVPGDVSVYGFRRHPRRPGRRADHRAAADPPPRSAGRPVAGRSRRPSRVS